MTERVVRGHLHTAIGPQICWSRGGSQFDVESIRGVSLVVVQGLTSPKLARTTYALLENDCSKVRACASLVLDARGDSRSCCLKERVDDLQQAVIDLYQTQTTFAVRVLTYTCYCPEA